MEIDVMKIVTDKIKDMEDNGTIKKAIEDTIESATLKAILSSIDGYKIKNIIEDKMTTEVSEIVKQIGFTAYNSFIAEKFKEIAEGVLREDITKKVMETFEGILIAKRESIKLSEICELYRDWICDEVDGQEKYDLQNFWASIGEHPGYSWIDCKFGREEPSGHYSKADDNSVEFVIHLDSKSKVEGAEKTGWISSVVIDGSAIDGKLKFGYMSRIELLLINISYNRTPIIMDVESEDDIDTSFGMDN